MRALVLWDVDGTLLRGGVAAREALDRALERAVGHPPGPHGVQMSGKTDPQILDEIATTVGVAVGRRARVVAEALHHLPETFEQVSGRLASEGRVLPGVPAVLRRLHGRGDVLQTMLTGNIAATAIGKVRAFGLDRWLVPGVGAYGSDDPDRERLVPVALRRAQAHTGAAFDPARVWVVGDTPRDLACARAGGVRCCLVATGRFGLAELDGLGADAVLPDLSDVEAVTELLAGGQ